MEEKSNTINLEDMLCLLFLFYEEVDKYAEKMRQGKIKINVYQKNFNDSYTDLDYIVQYSFKEIISKYNKNINIIGEENINEKMNKIIIDPNNEFLLALSNIKVTPDNKLKYKIPIDFKNEINLNTNEITIYIDPIDGTHSLVKYKYSSITSLIGICLNNKPFMGIIHYIFKIENEHNNTTYFNFPGKGIFCFDVNTLSYNKINVSTNENKFEFLISKSRSNQKMFDFIKTFPNNSYIQENSMGNKIIKCILNDYLYFTTGSHSLSLWDICAGCCILKEIDVNVYYFNGKEVSFIPTSNLEIEDNLVICLNKNKLKLFLANVNKYYK